MYVTSCRIAYHLQRCPLSGQSIHVLSDRAYKVCVCHHPPYTIGTSPEPRVFLYYVYAKCSSCMKCRRKFRRRFPCAPTMSTTKAINNFVKSFRATCSIPDSKRACRQHVLKKKLDEIGYWLETFPRKEMAQLAQQTGVSGSSARKAITELQRWHAIRQLRFNRQIWIHTNDFFFWRQVERQSV